jgi:hypothetical protein
MARGSSRRGTSIGPSAVLAGAKNARLAPNSMAIPISRPGEAQPWTVAMARARTLRISPDRQSSSTFLRS